MIEDRARQHQSIEQRYRHAYGYRLFQVAQHAAGSGAMDIQRGVLPSVRSRDHKRPAVDGKADVTDESFVENAIHSSAVVNSALGLADDTCPLCGNLRFRHGVKLQAGAKDG